jgi:hypothetical protein
MGGLVAAPHTPCNQHWCWTVVLVSWFVMGGLVECKCGKILKDIIPLFCGMMLLSFATVSPTTEIFDATQISFFSFVLWHDTPPSCRGLHILLSEASSKQIIRVNSCAFAINKIYNYWIV